MFIKKKELNLSNFNTNNVTNMEGMFGECSSLKKLDLSNFSIKSIDYMNNMFSGCSSLVELICKDKLINKQLKN